MCKGNIALECNPFIWENDLFLKGIIIAQRDLLLVLLSTKIKTAFTED